MYLTNISFMKPPCIFLVSVGGLPTRDYQGARRMGKNKKGATRSGKKLQGSRENEPHAFRSREKGAGKRQKLEGST